MCWLDTTRIFCWEAGLCLGTRTALRASSSIMLNELSGLVLWCLTIQWFHRFTVLQLISSRWSSWNAPLALRPVARPRSSWWGQHGFIWRSVFLPHWKSSFIISFNPLLDSVIFKQQACVLGYDLVWSIWIKDYTGFLCFLQSIRIEEKSVCGSDPNLQSGGNE